MEILEIGNPNEVRSMFEAITAAQRSMPSIIMVFATSKGILFLIINVILMSSAISTVWVDRESEARKEKFQQQRNTVIVGQRNCAFSPD